ncbi:MAG: S-methyl-5-thioribose-1-phosphate isomerase [Planctomycetes bacterium]|nr:S-methyl-5-thioribose-1-phosphate isomerase [Planctomycetota bacterium]
MLKTIEYAGNVPAVRIIDQRRLPDELVYLDLRTKEELYDAIKTLAVRGAPAIGIAAGYGLAREAAESARSGAGADEVRRILRETGEYLARSRPTAVNLFHAIDRITAAAERSTAGSGEELAAEVATEAAAIHEEDLEASRRMGEYGANLIADGASCLTHCNAGGLATGGLGTALAVFYAAAEQGKKVRVYADETRPLLQGARLTAFELKENGIPVTVITDNMAGFLMKQGKVDAVFVGADRIAANGDAANKIGTYGVAVLAKQHGVPFYVVAPISTFDTKLGSGEEIPIEERAADEVKGFREMRWAPEGVETWNPAFDVTPARFITAIVTEKGVLKAPYEAAIRNACGDSGGK